MNKLFRTSIAMIALALPVLLASCGTSSAPSERMLESRSVKSSSALFVAQLADSSSYLVIMNDDDNMAAYTYDNTKTVTWFTGSMQDDTFVATAKNGSSMTAVFKDGTISGRLNVANISSLNFTALPAEKLEAGFWLAFNQDFIKWLGSSDGMQTFKLHEEVTGETPDLTEPVPSLGAQVGGSSNSLSEYDCQKLALGFELMGHADMDFLTSKLGKFISKLIVDLWYAGCSQYGFLSSPSFPRHHP
jgi:hypothetical protein